MKNLKIEKMKGVKSQQGFTIIELVVVILLLGILTATALPRFMDVTSDARTAITEATAGGLTTSAQLFRAQWYAEGQTGPSGGDWTLSALGNGYPAAPTDDDQGCTDIYNDLLQSGRAALTTATKSGTGPTHCIYSLAEGNTVTYVLATGEAN